jgi:hypothetical protein
MQDIKSLHSESALETKRGLMIFILLFWQWQENLRAIKVENF